MHYLSHIMLISYQNNMKRLLWKNDANCHEIVKLCRKSQKNAIMHVIMQSCFSKVLNHDWLIIIYFTKIQLDVYFK